MCTDDINDTHPLIPPRPDPINSVLHKRRGVPLEERDRWGGRLRFVCVGGGGVSKRGKGRSTLPSPSSLLIIYTRYRGKGDVCMWGGRGSCSPFPPRPHAISTLPLEVVSAKHQPSSHVLVGLLAHTLVILSIHMYAKLCALVHLSSHERGCPAYRCARCLR